MMSVYLKFVEGCNLNILVSDGLMQNFRILGEVKFTSKYIIVVGVKGEGDGEGWSEIF